MTAHWVVIAAAVLTTLVAAAAGAALAAFAGQALPHAARHDLSVAAGTSLTIQGPVTGGQAGPAARELQKAIGAALPGVPFGFWSGSWSNPLGFVPAALPGPPASARGYTPLLQAAAMTAVRDHAVLVSGRWPSAPGGAAPGGRQRPIPAALPVTSAALLRLSVGDVLRLRDRVTGTPVTFKVTGLFAERRLAGTAASYWQLNSVPASGSTTAAGFITYGPLLVDPAAFGAALPVSSGTWVAQPDMAAFSDTDLAAISTDVTALQSSVTDSSTLSGLQVRTSLPAVLAGIANNLAVARSLLAICALQLLVLTVAALLAVARLLATQREGETALLTARGATRWQLTRLTAAEVVPSCAVVAAVGAIAGIWLARLLGDTLFSGTTDATSVSLTATSTWLEALAATAVVAVVAIGAMLFPVLRPGTATASRVRRGRQAAIASATRAGADLGLVVLAVLAVWQLRRYSAVSTDASGFAANVDPVLVLAPALALAAGTAIMLRLLPAAARAGDRLSARGRGLTTSLAGWQFSRQPLRQGGAALLLVMAVATGTLALAQHQSWTRSAGDQAAFATGADVRVDLPEALAPGATGTITGAAGVQGAMAVSSTTNALPADVVAVDARQAPRVALLRGDQSALTSGQLFRKIAPTSSAGGTIIGGHPAAVRLTVTVSPIQPKSKPSPVTALVTITDATGGSFQMATNSFPADGRPHLLTAPLGGTRVAYPLRLTQVTFGYPMPAGKTGSPVRLTVSAGARLDGWQAVATSPELDGLLSTAGTFGPAADPSGASLRPGTGAASVTFSPGYGLTVGVSAGRFTLQPISGRVTLTASRLAPAVVPAIATKAFIDANKAGVGALVSGIVGGVSVPFKIVAETRTFPTVTGSALIVDLTTLQSALTIRGSAPLPVTEWWLATAGHQPPAGLARSLPPGSAVTSRTVLAAATTGDPLSAAPQLALLAMAAAAVLLAVTGFWVSIAANIRQRRAENALLAALGVAQRSAAAQLFLEKLLLSVPAAALGLLLGVAVARLLVPAVTLTPTAQRPVPPPVTMFDLPQTVPLAVLVAVVPALAAALVVFRRPDPAAELRAAEAA
jgi:ABC-type antimicrobial peptide transport system permease subunit